MRKEGDEAVALMRKVYDKRRKLMVELMREVGFMEGWFGSFMGLRSFAGMLQVTHGT